MKKEKFLEYQDAASLVDTIEAAQIMNVNPGTLRRWRSLGLGPEVVRIGGRVRYQRSELARYLGEGEP